MEQEFRKKVAVLIQEKRRRKRWRKVAIPLCLAVAVTMSVWLSATAVAMESGTEGAPAEILIATETPTVAPTVAPTQEPTVAPTVTSVLAASLEDQMETKQVKLVVYDDGTENRLHGAVFQLKQQVDKTYEEVPEMTSFTVTTEGYELGELTFGQYQLTQLRAPNGYLMLDPVFEFVVGEAGITIVNEVEATDFTVLEDGTYCIQVYNWVGDKRRLPSTGGTGRTSYLAGGLLLAGAAFVGIKVRKQTYYLEREDHIYE